MNKRIILLRILVACLLILWLGYSALWTVEFFTQVPEPKIDQFAKPYTITIKDEHHAILRYDKDTVILFLENAYALGDQDIAFIYLSNNIKN